MKNSKKIRCFYLISFFMITNSLLFGFLFRSIGFQFWRQTIWFIGIVIFYKIIQQQSYDKQRLKKLSRYFKVCFIILLLFSIKTILIDQFSITRVLNSVVNSVYGFAFIGMACLFANNKNRERLFVFLHWLGIFISVGLIIDSTTPVFAVFQIDDSMVARSGERATFLTENPTTLGVFYNFLMLCTFYRLYVCRMKIVKLFYFGLSFLYLIGAWVTGSRQIVLVIICSMLIVYFGLVIKKTKYFVGLALFTIIIGAFLGTSVYSLFENVTSGVEDRYTKKAVIEDDERRKLWMDGAKQLLPENAVYWFLGKGIGAASDRFVASSTEYVGSHFENTYFARFSEMGFFSWYILMFPIIYFLMLFLKNKKTFFSILMFASLSGYCIICWLSPNGSAPQSQITVFLTLGFMLYRDRYDIDYNLNSIKHL